jgi:hypothetical protein
MILAGSSPGDVMSITARFQSAARTAAEIASACNEAGYRHGKYAESAFEIFRDSRGRWHARRSTSRAACSNGAASRTSKRSARPF